MTEHWCCNACKYGLRFEAMIKLQPAVDLISVKRIEKQSKQKVLKCNLHRL